MVGRAQASGWKNIPAPSPQACKDWARPACLAADSGLQEPSLLSPPSSPNLLLHQFSSGTSLLARAEEMVSFGKKNLGNNKNSPPQT